MAQTKEEQQENARQRKASEEWDRRNAEIVRGRPLREGEGKAARSEWDTGIFDRSNPPKHVYCHYNYRLGRSEWSMEKVPDQYRDDYESALWPKLPDGRSAVMYPDEAKRLGIGLGMVVEHMPPTRAVAPQDAPKSPARRWTLPVIDKTRA
jgi:hypothetical protein